MHLIFVQLWVFPGYFVANGFMEMIFLYVSELPASPDFGIEQIDSRYGYQY